MGENANGIMQYTDNFKNVHFQFLKDLLYPLSHLLGCYYSLYQTDHNLISREQSNCLLQLNIYL